MQWVHQFDLFLLDFDGLLVNTEELHFLAYQKMTSRRGYQLPWDFYRFCAIAHASSTGIRDSIYDAFPKLYEQQPDWSVLYREKKELYQKILENEELRLMPGVEKFLLDLEKSNIKRCVVTNSTSEQTNLIRFRLKTLDTIPFWITREEYSAPKPDPECYLKALQRYGSPRDRVVGFEDSLRGVMALQEAKVLPILICYSDHPQFNSDVLAQVTHFPSFDKIPDSWEPPLIFPPQSQF